MSYSLTSLGHVDTRLVERHYRHRLTSSVDVAVVPMAELLASDGRADLNRDWARQSSQLRDSLHPHGLGSQLADLG